MRSKVKIYNFFVELLLVQLFQSYVTEKPLSDWHPGIATHFQGPQDLGEDLYDPKVPPGSCGYGELDPKLYPFWDVAQMSANSPMVQGEVLSGCGACFEVRCLDEERCFSQLTTKIMVTDSCQNCVQQQLNLHVFAFQHLAPSKWGEIPIEFRRINCDPPGGMVVRITDYRKSQGGWLRLVILNIAGKADIATVELRQHNQSTWKQLSNYYGAAWEMSVLPEPPYDLRVTLQNGEYVVLGNVIDAVRVGGLYESKSQFHRDVDLNDGGQRSQSVRGEQIGNFPVLSMPPVDPSIKNTSFSATPYPSNEPIIPLSQIAQRGKPQVSLLQLLNPGITLSPASSRSEYGILSDFNTILEDQQESGTEEEEENLYSQTNSTDWQYIRQAFQRIGLLGPAAEENS